VRTKDEWFYRLPTWIRLGIISLMWLLLLFIQFLVFGIKSGNSILSKPMADYRIFCIGIISSIFWLFLIIRQSNILIKYLAKQQPLSIMNFKAHCSIYVIIMLLSLIQIIITIICYISVEIASLVSQYPCSCFVSQSRGSLCGMDIHLCLSSCLVIRLSNRPIGNMRSELSGCLH
jgi:hypothetical protein